MFDYLTNSRYRAIRIVVGLLLILTQGVVIFWAVKAVGPTIESDDTLHMLACAAAFLGLPFVATIFFTDLIEANYDRHARRYWGN